MRARAAVSDGKGHFVIDEVELGEPQANELLVEIKASGVCHTDFDHMNCSNRTYIMGHEGARVRPLRGSGVHPVAHRFVQ